MRGSAAETNGARAATALRVARPHDSERARIGWGPGPVRGSTPVAALNRGESLSWGVTGASCNDPRSVARGVAGSQLPRHLELAQLVYAVLFTSNSGKADLSPHELATLFLEFDEEESPSKTSKRSLVMFCLNQLFR